MARSIGNMSRPPKREASSPVRGSSNNAVSTEIVISKMVVRPNTKIAYLVSFRLGEEGTISVTIEIFNSYSIPDSLTATSA